MTPNLPDLLIADLLVDPSRNVRARDRSSDGMVFSNALDEAKVAAGDDNQLIKAGQRQTGHRQVDRFAASERSDARSGTRARAEEKSEHSLDANRTSATHDVEAKFTERRESIKLAESDLASAKALQERSEASALDRIQVQARADEIKRDEARAERASEASATKEEPVGRQVDDQGDGSHQEARSGGGGADDLSRSQVEAFGPQVSGGDAGAMPTSVEPAAGSAIVAGAIAATLSVGMVSTGSAGTTANPSGITPAVMAPGAVQAPGIVGVTGIAGVSATSGTSVTAGASISGSAGGSELSAWGAMSAARAGSSADGVDRMARQLGLLRSIQSASTAADSSKVTQLMPAQQGSPAGSGGANAPSASLTMTDTGGSAASDDPVESVSGGSRSVEVAGTSAATMPKAAPLSASVPENSLIDGTPEPSLTTNFVSQSGVSLPNSGLLSAEFVPVVPSKPDVEPLSGGGGFTKATGATQLKADLSASGTPDVAQGFAQIAQQFDQANAAADARVARAQAQRQGQFVVPNNPIAVSPLTAQETGQSVDMIAAGGAGLLFDGSIDGAHVSVLAGLSASGSSNQSGLGSDSGGRSTGDSSDRLETGGGAAARGPRFGGAVLGAATSAPSSVSSAFGGAPSVANGPAGTSGQEIIASASAAAGSSGVAFAAGAVAVAADAAVSNLPGSGVASAITPQTIGGSLRLDASGPATVQSPVTADQLPVALDQTAIDLARLRGGMLTLELAPADLGRLSFEMRIDDSGAAFVAIRLADDTVRALVENAAGALRDSLSREGFKLDSFTVSSGFSSPEQRENSQNQAFSETSNRRVQSSGSSVGSGDSVQSRASNTQVRPGTSSLSLFA